LESIKINEIFYSLQGESSLVGLPTAFIRLTGCPMRCNYCDTAYAFNEGKNLRIIDILKEINNFKTKYVTVTGGEPLAQKLCFDLLSKLCDKGYFVSLETGGAVSIAKVDPRVKIILDIKTPYSGESENNKWNNLSLIKTDDEIKFVIANSEDYEWAKKLIDKENIYSKAQIIFSPVYNKLSTKKLSNWILRDHLPVRMQVQLHKFIWGDIPGV
jgi:7-carboxy-7-deazaguanine synthase|tara:strand:+ start:1936 stop:2577 length:642 start_codon:yes stop_codon:yes gene_type:complete